MKDCVAWRWRLKGSAGWLHASEKPTHLHEGLAWEIEPLFSPRPEAVTIDPGTEKILRTLLDRAYAMMAMSGYRVAEVNADHNNPIIAWMSDAAAVLYGSGRRPDPVADLQGTPRSPLAGSTEKK